MEYEIKTIADFAKVPNERLSACVQEFVCCLFEFRKLQSETGFALEKFTWIDDGIPMVQAVDIEVENRTERIHNPNFKGEREP